MVVRGAGASGEIGVKAGGIVLATALTDLP
jgi:hypothetical protein